MRPKLGVIIELREFVDLILGLNIAVLGNADVDPNPASVRVFPIHTGVQDRLVGTIDPDTASPSSTSHILFGLMLFRVKIANPCIGFANVANLVVRYAAASVQ